jgi:hypothetical protein
MPRFIRNHPIWFALLALLLAYGLWWLYQDYDLTAYPRRIAASLPIPPGSELVDTTLNGYRQCRSAGIRQYFTTNDSWDRVVEYYKGNVHKPWQLTQSELIYDQYSNNYELFSIGLHHIDLATEDEYRNNPQLQRALSKRATAYFVQIFYNQDIRVCKSED